MKRPSDYLPAPDEEGPNTADPKAQRKLPDIEDAAALVARELPEPLELVEGLLHQGSKLVLGGSSKSNKTWCLVDLALSVAFGEPWLSCTTRKGRVPLQRLYRWSKLGKAAKNVFAFTAINRCLDR